MSEELDRALKAVADLTATQPNRDWIQRVREADREAEAVYLSNVQDMVLQATTITEFALLAIAAELRAQRIARRPGAGQA